MNNATLTLIVTAAGSAGTIAAAFIYKSTLKELRRQRLEKYLPSLFIDRATFFVQGARLNDIAMPYKWNQGAVLFGKFYTDFEPLGRSNRFYLNLYNIGFGIAKNIEVRFSYAIEDFIIRINELAAKVPEDRRIRIELGANLLSLTSMNQTLPFNTFAFSHQIYTKSDFNNIIPFTISNNYTLLDLPLSFMELFNIYMHYVGYLLGKEQIEINPPILTIEISYQNIANEDLRQNFTLTTDLNQPFGGGSYGGQLIIAEGE